MKDSVFTKIIKGEIPCHKIYEDDQSLAFLDIQPNTYGHTLVIPKLQKEHLWDLDEELYLHLMVVARKVANRQREVLKPERVGMVLEGFGVPDHVHVHVFPLYESVEATYEHRVPKPTDQELADMAKKLRFE